MILKLNFEKYMGFLPGSLNDMVGRQHVERETKNIPDRVLSRQKTQTYEIVWCMLGTILGSLSITAFLSFTVVIFYPINLLNSLSSSCSFSEYSLRFFTYIILTLWPRIGYIMINILCVLKKIQILLLLSGVFNKCQLGQVGWQCCSSLLYHSWFSMYSISYWEGSILIYDCNCGFV